MGQFRSILTAAILFSALIPYALASQEASSTVVVTTGEAQSQVLVSGVEVQLAPIGRTGKSDIVGELVFRGVPTGRHHIVARRFGFEPISAYILCAGGDTVRVTLLMGPAAHQLDTLRVDAHAVSAYLREFDGRRTMGLGRFVTEFQLDSLAGRDLAEVLATRFAGTQARYGPVGLNSRYLVSTRGTSSTGSMLCALGVYLDRVRLAGSDISLIRPETLAGVEYYNEITVPAQYRSGSACGVLVLWSRF